jgi:hypothetical protein
MDDTPLTPYPDANALFPVVLAALQEMLGPKLVGLSVFGSLVTGAYEPGISDVDFVAALTDDLTEAEGARITRMHAEIVAAHPVWTSQWQCCGTSGPAARWAGSARGSRST